MLDSCASHDGNGEKDMERRHVFIYDSTLFVGQYGLN